MKIYAEIRKIDEEARMVYGYAATEALDASGEIVTKQALEKALPDYMKFGNVREMHQPSAVGVTRAAGIDDKGLYIGAHIVDDVAWRKVRSGVYKGFSIGGRVESRDPERRAVITGLKLSEISLVDRPANPETVFDLWKSGVDSRAAPATRSGEEDMPDPAALAAMVKETVEIVDMLQKRLSALEVRVGALEPATGQAPTTKGVLLVVPKEADDLRKMADVEKTPATALDAIRHALRHPQPAFAR